jgi:hypothetical protein
MTDPASLVGSWAHSHEEDHDGIEVFRPGGYAFPPSRGRAAFTLRPDATAAAGLPGPDDRGGTVEGGSWEVRGDVLDVRCPGWGASYRVVTAGAERLELQPI